MSPSFDAPTGTGTPFGRNEFLRSTKTLETESYTVAKSTVPTKDYNGTLVPTVQPGTVMAKITSGPDAGKVGPYSTDTVGVTDGRSSAANIVGLLLTFAPWQFMDRDVECSVVYECVAVQGWCYELDATGAPVPLSNTTADAMRGTKGLDILFK